MKDRSSKIFGLIFFLFLCGGILYLLFAGPDSNKENKYEKIEITNNKLLTENEYLKYLELYDTTIFKELTLADIKVNLERHPYIIRAEVSHDGINKIEAELTEKIPKALIITDNEFKLVTEKGELLPLLNKNIVNGLPIISNIKRNSKELLDENELEAAFKIINAVQLIDENMYESLAEINLRNGGDILIMFAGFRFPIVFGKNSETRKILALKNIWSNLINEKGSNYDIEYIDLRYKNKIFIGKRKPTETTG
ncbi:MAG: cell division protein FtsQ/DivIB [Ignavibacteria bacterium]|nr:cell division protein FtsQ/DivIB [Ignavibacteria bacterium]MBT8381809.1 cell division protein FtsQ/DivIB [Ignavibacteria bacterium]MBT8392478.1 cell division protein FtsQ/DivIB [Ignavibacteria bacterium]NNJ52060.1 FtsQ-type POTRA domain-containing protein [Ignavibacteriaceae bacterium]NNL19891.1 FtsQ-type POTRA domain-containing protein [Ignavibacteriaceae bacterium]